MTSSDAIPPLGRAVDESLEDLGYMGKAALLSNLRRRGIFLDDRRISLSLLHDVLMELLGEQATEMIMENVIIAMDRLHDVRLCDSDKRQMSP